MLLHPNVRTNDFNEFPQVTYSNTEHITWVVQLSLQNRLNSATTLTKRRCYEIYIYLFFALSSSAFAWTSAYIESTLFNTTEKKKKCMCSYNDHPHYIGNACTHKTVRHVHGQRYLLFMLMDMDELDTLRDSKFHLYRLVWDQNIYVIIKLPNNNATNVNDMLINTHRSSTLALSVFVVVMSVCVSVCDVVGWHNTRSAQQWKRPTFSSRVSVSFLHLKHKNVSAKPTENKINTCTKSAWQTDEEMKTTDGKETKANKIEEIWKEWKKKKTNQLQQQYSYTHTQTWWKRTNRINLLFCYLL